MIPLRQRLRRFLRDKAYRRSLGYRVRLPVRDAQQSPEYYITTATIVRDEAKYIREFVAFHKLVGVDRMLIYMDGGADEQTVDALADFVAAGFVELIAWPRLQPRKNNQFLAYKDAVVRMHDRTKWLAMIDADEFLFAPQSGQLRLELERREKFSALSVYSFTFGTGGVAQLPSGALVTENLRYRGPDDHIKNRTQRTIVQPKAVAAIRSANTFVLGGTDCLGWDEDGKPVYATGEANHGSKHLRIHHYFTRAEDDFQKKLARQYFGKSNYSAKMMGKDMEASDGGLSLVMDETLNRYVPRLKTMIESDFESRSK